MATETPNELTQVLPTQVPTDKLTPVPQPNSASPGRLNPADRIGIPAQIIIGVLGDRPGPAPKHVGPPPVAVAPVPLPIPEVK